MILLSISEDEVFSQANVMMRFFFGLALSFFLIVLIYFIWMIKDVRRENLKMDEQLKNVQYMHEVEKELFDAHLHPENFKRALKKVSDYLTAEAAFFWIINGHSDIKYCYNGSGIDFDIDEDNEMSELFPGLFNILLERGGILSYDMKAVSEEFPVGGKNLAQFNINNLMLIPVSGSGGELTIIFGACNMKRRWESDVPLRQVSLSFFMALNHYEAHYELERLGRIDNLTGLLNRNSFSAALERLSSNKPKSFGCVYIDVNGLHEINNCVTLLALGINHKTAPVSLRERVSFSPDKLDQALDSLLAQPMVQGGVVLSTCNRTELYLSVEERDDLQEALIRWLCDYHNLNEDDLRNSLYWHQDNDAVSHLMRVASGLDSLVLGEPQILGQVKKAFADSQKGHMKASELERMFQKSFSVAKRVRTETDIGASAVSVAFAACTLARQIFESLSTVTVLLVGAGETIELVARHLREHKVQKMIIANRTRERAQILADEVGAEIIALSDIDERLREADIIISSTASPLPIIGKGMVERALKSRRNQPMLLVDIAVPRDVEPEVGKLANAYLYSVDDLQSIISHNLAQRKAAAVEAETIVAQETSEFMAWLRAQSASETIREYRSQAEHVRDELTAKALAALEQGGDAQAIMQDLAWKLTNRLIHAPTKSLQQAARDGDNERLNILRDSLGLE